MSYISSDKMAGDMDVMELFGGEAGTTRIALRRRLRTAENFDLSTGADLTDKKVQRILYEYVEQHQPLVVVMGPPCTAFASWSNCNRWKYPHSWQRSREIGMILAEVAAKIIEIQMKKRRFFVKILRDPTCSSCRIFLSGYGKPEILASSSFLSVSWAWK